MTNYTAEQIAAMSDDDLRQVIAEALGYKKLVYSNSTGLLYGYTPILNELRALPEWATDANPAMCLLEGTECIVRWSRIHDAWRAGFSDWEDREFVINESAPRAICGAWLLWRQSAGGDA